jgi:hypothetical protein
MNIINSIEFQSVTNYLSFKSVMSFAGLDSSKVEFIGLCIAAGTYLGARTNQIAARFQWNSNGDQIAPLQNRLLVTYRLLKLGTLVFSHAIPPFLLNSHANFLGYDLKTCASIGAFLIASLSATHVLMEGSAERWMLVMSFFGDMTGLISLTKSVDSYFKSAVVITAFLGAKGLADRIGRRVFRQIQVPN